MIIQLQNGTSFDTADYNLKRLFHRIPSPEINHQTASVEGRSDIITSTKINNRTISVEFLYQTYDIYDYYLLRDRLNGLFVRNEYFYITFKREPYKRWKVRLASQFETEPDSHMKSFTVDFITENIWAESNFISIDFFKQWDVNEHAWNNIIDWDSSPPQYQFLNNNFVVRNFGEVTVDPREHELEIFLNGEFPNGVSIINQTTGETYRYNRALPSTSNIILRGIRTLRDDVSDFVSTNKRLITLAPGDNAISIEGGTVNVATFNFRFLYK